MVDTLLIQSSNKFGILSRYVFSRKLFKSYGYNQNSRKTVIRVQRLNNIIVEVNSVDKGLSGPRVIPVQHIWYPKSLLVMFCVSACDSYQTIHHAPPPYLAHMNQFLFH